MGVWLYPIGRPTSVTKPKWRQLCNFSLTITRRVERAPGSSIGENGWIIEIKTQDHRRICCTIATSIVSSSANLNRYIMGHVAGTSPFRGRAETMHGTWTAEGALPAKYWNRNVTVDCKKITVIDVISCFVLKYSRQKSRASHGLVWPLHRPSHATQVNQKSPPSASLLDWSMHRGGSHDQRTHDENMHEKTSRRVHRARV